MYFLGIDLGSSSIKLSVLDAEAGKSVASVTVPDFELEINAPQDGWAEQDPQMWWQYVKDGIVKLRNEEGVDVKKIQAVGIAYQMHGLVLVDENLAPVRSSIIWCDSRAAQIGDETYEKMGAKDCQEKILGSPGNFTASKLKWVKENQPEILAKAKYMMLPGDFIAAKLSGVAQISTSGLSEGALWNFKENRLATEVLEAMDLPSSLIPEIVPNFGKQAKINPEVAKELGLCEDVYITYRAGDQPNNALSLNALNPGEIAATAGTSAVVYGVSQTDDYDVNNRINTFLHVNNAENFKRNGVMVCINGSGILYQWLRKILSEDKKELIDYEKLNSLASESEIGAKGLLFYPFGNGVERIFNNKPAFSGLKGLNFNIHQKEDLVRAACEGIVFALNYGFEIMRNVGVEGKVVRAGKANLFLNPIFREIFVNTTNTILELYNTSGSEGAARGAAYGFGYFSSLEDAFSGLECVERTTPDPDLVKEYRKVYETWKNGIS
ncbi:xylulokinase [Galbibacter mesophilus]|uniref:xylulokinase n=1 Tax=Galbibacter mesophilus TaxID=379069 RepID=UPI00191CB0DF|nr:FGGY family carbohydrate kinase [Galbibacter mesophilus]MCM5661432.1 FGGY family carbohydrate kinase [Galbibacter mesophilus]